MFKFDLFLNKIFDKKVEIKIENADRRSSLANHQPRALFFQNEVSLEKLSSIGQ
jgi:hypothetical protein